LRDSAVIRWLEGELVWYPPGSSAPPRRLSDEAELEQLRSIVAARRAPLIYAAPGADVTLRELGFTAQEKRHIGKSLPFLLEDEFAADIDTLHFASRPLGKLRMGVAVCEHERMVEWQEALSGLPATNQWIPEPLLLPWQPGELCIVFEGADIVRATACAADLPWSARWPGLCWRRSRSTPQ
jgi:type II secretory pathway component PulL